MYVSSVYIYVYIYTYTSICVYEKSVYMVINGLSPMTKWAWSTKLTRLV